MIKMWLLNTGYCTVSEHHILQGSKKRMTKAHALAFLLEHPRKGFILFDTGYAPRILEAFKLFPYTIYGRLTPTTTQAEWSVVKQLKTLGISPQDIRYVIVSHLHADHIAGLHDFKEATVILSKEASKLLSSRGFAALKHGFLPMLFPQTRVKCIEAFADESLEYLGLSHDVFNDGLLHLIQFPGHARGQMGVLLESHHGPVLLAADGAWSSKSFRENIPPDTFAMRLAFDNVLATLDTLNKLHLFHQEYPGIKIIPTHCREIIQKVELGSPTPFEVW